MSIRSLLGLVVFNALLLGVGVAALLALLGWRSWYEVARTSGLAYMLGVALVGVTLSVELALGVPFSFATVLLTCVALSVGALGARSWLARWRPPVPARRMPGGGLVAVAFGALIVVCLEAMFRAGRLASLSAWDAWSFWVPKAKAIYFFGGLDEQFFRELPNPAYPPLVPALEAAAFHFMGSADVVTLHLQFWFFACGFVAAVAGLLAPRVPALLLWPFLLLVLVAPRVVGRMLDPQADFLLDYLFALAAVLVALWVVDREAWLLATATVFMGGALLTKREGLLLVACILAAALVGSASRWRHAWPRLALAGGVAAALAIPWRIWFTSRDLTGELPSAGVLAPVDNPDRGWPAFESAIATVLDFDLWLLTVPLVGVGVVLAFIAGKRALPAYTLTLYGLTIAGLTWTLWSFTELELPFTQDEGVNPIVRLSGSLVIASAAFIPLLLHDAWRGADEEAEPR